MIEIITKPKFFSIEFKNGKENSSKKQKDFLVCQGRKDLTEACVERLEASLEKIIQAWQR